MVIVFPRGIAPVRDVNGPDFSAEWCNVSTFAPRDSAGQHDNRSCLPALVNSCFTDEACICSMARRQGFERHRSFPASFGRLQSTTAGVPDSSNRFSSSCLVAHPTRERAPGIERLRPNPGHRPPAHPAIGLSPVPVRRTSTSEVVVPPVFAQRRCEGDGWMSCAHV